MPRAVRNVMGPRHARLADMESLLATFNRRPNVQSWACLGSPRPVSVHEIPADSPLFRCPAWHGEQWLAHFTETNFLQDQHPDVEGVTASPTSLMTPLTGTITAKCRFSLGPKFCFGTPRLSDISVSQMRGMRQHSRSNMTSLL